MDTNFTWLEETVEKEPSLSSYKKKQLPVHVSKWQKNKNKPVPTSQEQIFSRMNSICLYQWGQVPKELKMGVSINIQT